MTMDALSRLSFFGILPAGAVLALILLALCGVP